MPIVFQFQFQYHLKIYFHQWTVLFPSIIILPLPLTTPTPIEAIFIFVSPISDFLAVPFLFLTLTQTRVARVPVC